MFEVELLGKIIYLCDRLLLEKLLEIFGKHLHLGIWKAFILAYCIIEVVWRSFYIVKFIT